MGWYYNSYPQRKSAAEIKADAKRNIKKDYHPVTVEGRRIADTWWGDAWCRNIDFYADQMNRLSRGKNYVRSGLVIDLCLDGGTVTAKVQGSRKKPYDIAVKVDPVKSEVLSHIMEVCKGSLESLSDLEEGRFPEEYKDLFTNKGEGLFPTMREIHFSCSCPDSARVCKHVAAVLYAIGRRLDDQPLLFLSLRGIDVSRFASNMLRQEVERIWASSDSQPAPGRTMDEKEAAGLFGFERFDEEIDVKAVMDNLRVDVSALKAGRQL